MTAEECKAPGPTDYNSTATPAGYACGTCGAAGVKLWRLYQTFLDHQELTCASCAAAAEGCSIADIDANGRRMVTDDAFAPDSRHRTDLIGNRIPAVPTEEGNTYWGYTSVPPLGVLWWRRLPTLPVTSRSIHDNG